MIRRLFLVFALLLTSCGPPRARLTFPYRALTASSQTQWFDVDRDGKNDFAMTFDDAGRVDALLYDDNQDGSIDRVYHLRDYANDTVPHAIILLDSVPFQCVAERYAAGDFRWFDPPQKVIAPFPSLTELSYNELLHGPPQPGMIDQYYDPRRRRVNNGLFQRAFGRELYPWERELRYRSNFLDEGFAYLDPKPWYRAELERARQALESSSDRVTIVYLTSASGMACKYGRAGIDEVLDGAAQLCVQLLYKHHGAIKISLMADHGHNLTPSKNIHVEDLLRSAGFHPSEQSRSDNDVVVEMNGLVTYAGVWTSRPAKVADALFKNQAIEMTMYRDGDRVIIRNAAGAAAIECRGDRLRYLPISTDVLKYQPLLAKMNKDADGFVTRDDWFNATVDHEFPDGPARVWDAFHRLVRNPPDLLFTTRDGYCAGLADYERYIDIKSTHGSLNQINSATFLLTMTGRATHSMRTRDVMATIEPSYKPGARTQR